MKAFFRITVVLTLVAGSVWIGGDRVGAFSYFTYGGYTVVWPGGQSLRYLSPGTFPEGSDPDILIQASMGQWSSVPGGGFQYSFIRLAEDPVIDPYDGYSDTAAVPAEWLDPGVLGVTYMVNYMDQWYDMDILFSDYPEDVGWHMLTNPDCEVTSHPTPDNGFSFYLVGLHELGHAIGLGHDPIGDEPPGSPWFIATLNPGYPAGGPVGQGNIVELHTDDRRGVRFLYPGSSTMVDLANASYCSQGPTLGKAVPTFVDPPSVTPGQELTAWCVIENFGTVGVTDVRQGFYLSTDGVVDSGDLLLGDILWDMPANDGFEFSVGIDIPDLLAGTYTFGSMLDDLDEVAEHYEDNNDAICCDPFTIGQAVPTFEPFSQQVITCAGPFVGPTPDVHYPINTAPITWSLDNPQPGMTINPNTGDVSWPEPIKAPFIYELDVRATNAAGTSVQTLPLGVHQGAPAIVAIPDEDLPCRDPYTGPTPVLTAPACMEPINAWSLIDGPDGMVINPSSGVVSWPDPPTLASSHRITIRASNDTGSGTASWDLSIVDGGGDLDENGVVEITNDLPAFVAVLLGQDPGPGYNTDQADVNCDGAIDGMDIGSFVNVLLTGGPSLGACCYADGSCSEEEPADCYAQDGVYRGDGTTCASVDCDGACCFPTTGGCLTFSLDYCNTAGGTFQGMGTDCAELSCPPIGQGACCFPDESCSHTTLADCGMGGGTYRGLGMSCDVVDCSTPLGACCHSDGTCSEGTEDDCDVVGGTYMGDETVCSGATCLGACCYPSGACLDLSQPDCGISGGVFQGPGTNCSSTDCPVVPQGACCHANETCTIETQTSCSVSGGSYQGDDTTCETTDCSAAARGACCLPDESCTEVTEAACGLAGGTFIGEGTLCSSVDCSLTDVGACYDPSDWSCVLTSPAICAALGHTFEGSGTACASTMAPEYRNDIANPTTYWAPGASKAMADDMSLAGTSRGMSHYDLAVYGTGGGTFDVTTGLYDGCPGEGGVLIAGTQATWEDIPADDGIYLISVDASAEPVTIPDTVWMVATFSDDDAGWVLAEEAEVGTTADLYGENDPPWVCNYWFGGPPDPYAGFWADIQCVDVPEGQGACCHPDESCTEGTPSVCDAAGGLYMGDDTTCGTTDCTGLDIGACCSVDNWDCTITTQGDCAASGDSFDGYGTTCDGACPEYRNEISPATLSYNPGKPMADDLAFAGTARDASYFEIAVYGGGGGTFDVSTAFYNASPCAGGAQIPGTLVSGYGLPDNGQVLVLNVTFPTPVTLPDEVWLVVEFSNAYAGWIVAEEAEVGSTEDRFAMATYNEGTEQWEWTCNYQIDDPPNDPHAGFWVSVQCVNAGGRARSRQGGGPVMTVTPTDWGVHEPVRCLNSVGLLREAVDGDRSGPPLLRPGTALSTVSPPRDSSVVRMHRRLIPRLDSGVIVPAEGRRLRRAPSR
ncbi:MAG: hypothetical protein JXQ75_18550 [Phycisphaerae bacterium]|nr:hypothetical protein [Phycisphaerae bacterium]